MKAKKDYTLLALFIPFSIACLFEIGIGCQVNKDARNEPVSNNKGQWELDTDNVMRFYTPPLQPVSVEYFKQGQILLPDYCCPDTMIVRDAVGLNKAIAYVEQYNDTLVETDSEIDSLFHVYCDYYIGSYEDQFQKLKSLQPTWDSLQIATAINED